MLISTFLCVQQCGSTFSFASTNAYHFTSLPIGLATYPREFTKLLRLVMHPSHIQGVRLHVYLDDWLIWVDSRDDEFPTGHMSVAPSGMDKTFKSWNSHLLRILSSSGWTPGLRNSPWPSPLPKMRIKVQVLVPLVLGHSSVSIKHRLLGTIQYMAPWVPRRWLYFSIQWWALTAWDQTSEDCSSRIGPNIYMSQIWSSISCHGGFPRQYGQWLPLRVRDTVTVESLI